MITANIASHLPMMAQTQPNTYAVVKQKKTAGPAYAVAYTYRQLDEISDIIANGLEAYGICKGTRTVLMVKPGLDFFALVFALFKLEAVLVAVDPGMGIKNLGQCLGEAEPEAFIGIARAHLARIILGWARHTVTKPVLVGKPPLINITDLDRIKSLGGKTRRKNSATRAEDTAAILFTSGSTGLPKGAVYTHANFTAQVNALKELYGIQPGEIDLATFPLFALFAPALGMTSIIPDMDFTKPGKVDPKKIIDAITQYKCTNMFGSPALLNRVGRWAEHKSITLPSLKRVLCAGAPVAAAVLKSYKKLLNNNVQIFTPYGATEALPVSSIGSDAILQETAGATAAGQGVCVGPPVDGVALKIIRITDQPIPDWDAGLELPTGTIGEICVQGAQVTRAYVNNDKATGLAKLNTTDGFYHRMGDVGYLDRRRRLWFCGRKSQRVITAAGTLFTICCEGVFNTHPQVFRTALVGAAIGGETVPVICVELEPAHKRCDKRRLTAELLRLGSASAVTSNIKQVLFHPGFPVDIRHNAKIARERLAVWAANKLPGSCKRW